VSKAKSKPYARKNSRARCHFTTADGRQCTEPRSRYCLHHSSQKRRDADLEPKVTAADIFGRYQKLSSRAISHILTQVMVEFMNGRITHTQASALICIARLMLRNLENANRAPSIDLPLAPWRAEAVGILSGITAHAMRSAEELDTVA
jgi:hypothetical protein